MRMMMVKDKDVKFLISLGKECVMLHEGMSQKVTKKRKEKEKKKIKE